MKYSLFFDTQEEIDQSVLQFIKLESILALFLHSTSDVKKMKKALARRVSSQECVLRRDLFRDLENENTFCHFQDLYRKICNYELAREKYLFFKGSKYEALFFVHALEACFQMFQVFVTTQRTKYTSKLILDFIAQFEKVYNFSYNQNLLMELQCVSNTCSQSHITCIDLSKRDTHCKATSISSFGALDSMLDDFAEILEIGSCAKTSMVRLSEFSFEQLFFETDEYFIQIHEFFVKYKDCELLDITIDKDSFSFFINIKSIFAQLRKRGLPFCLPHESSEKRIFLDRFYDISLLLEHMDDTIVLNSFDSYNTNNVYIVSGANGGGKTCFLRGVCLAAFFSSIGVYIPAAYACLFPELNLFAFCGVEENSASGIYLQEKQFVEDIMQHMNANSVLFLNEIMIGTGEMKACRELKKITEKIIAKTASLFCATHNYAYVEWVETHLLDVTLLQPVLKPDGHERTYVIEDVSTAHCSYSKDILQKYGLTQQNLEVKKVK